MKPKGHSRLFATSATLIVATFAAPCALAVSDAWDGSTNATWATTTNWLTDPASAPGTGETATFNAASGFTTIDLGAGVSVGSIVFDGTSAAYTLGSGAVGSQSLTLDNAGAVNMNAGVANNQLINAQLNLSTAANATNTLSNNSTSLLTIAGNINAVPPAGNSLLTVSGSGNTTITGALTETGAGNSALLKTGAGTLTISNSGTYTGSGALGRIPATAAGFPLVAREGVLLFNGGTQTVTGELVIGGVVADGGAGQNTKLQVDAGTLAVSSWLSLGRGNGVGGVSSDLVANNASVITAGDFSAGFNGTNAANLSKGTFTLNGTSSFTVNGNGAFNFGESTGSHMTMTLNNSATVTAAGTGIKRIGNLGTGILNINNSAGVSFGNQLVYLGYRSGNGTLNMTGGTLTTGGDVRVGGSDTNNGAAENAVGTLNISGGTATLGGLVLARGNNNAATVTGTGTISGGTVNVQNDLTLGFAGSNNLGKLTVSGGTLNVGTLGGKWLMVGRWDTSRGQLDITSGALNLYGNSQIKMNADGTVGANVVNQSGGAVTFYSDAGTTVGGTGHLDLQRAGGAASNNTYNLNGGTLTVPQVISSASSGTRAFNFNGGTLKATGNNVNFVNLGTGNQTANILAGGALIDSNNFNVTIPQLLGGAGAGGLTKLGAGNLTLSAANTYSGPTLVSGGTLTLTNSSSSSGITVNGSGAKLVHANSFTLPSVTLTNGTVDGIGSITSLTVANSATNLVTNGNGTGTPLTIETLSFNDAATVNVDLTSGVAGIQTTNLDSGAAAGGKITVNATAPVWSPGTYDLITYSGTIGGGGFAEFQKGTISGLSGRQNAVLTHSAGNSVALTITGDNPVWTGAFSGDWNTNVTTPTKNWKLISSGAATDYLNNDNVLFDDTATGTTNVNISTANVSPLTTTFSNSGVLNSGLDYVISSTGGFGIATGNVTLNGTGLVTLATPNTYPGGTIINAGTLNIDHASAIGTGALTIGGFSSGIDNTSGSAITLSTNNVQNWNSDFTFYGSNALNLGTGAVTMSGDRLLTVQGTGPLTVGGAVSGTGFGLAKLGTGTLVLTGTNTYNGITSVREGTLSVTAGTTGTLNASVEVSPDSSTSGTLNVSGGTLNATRIILGGNNGNGGNPGSATMTQSAGVVNSSQWFTVGSGVNGVATPAAGDFTMTGGVLNASTVGTQNMEIANFTAATGTVTISGSSAINVYNNASIAIGSNNNAGNGTFNQNGGTVTFYSNAGTTVGGTGSLRLGNAGESPATSAFTYNLNGGTLTVPSVSRNAGGGNLGPGIFNFNSGTLKATNATATYMQGLTEARVLAGGALIDDAGFAITIGQPLVSGIAGDGGLTKSGVGTLSLTGAGTYVGPTTVTAGTLALTGAGSVNGSSGISINGSGAKFVQASSVAVSPAITVTNGTLDGAGAVGNVTIADNAANILTNGNGGNAGMTAGNLVFNGAATLNLKPASPATPVVAASTLTTGASGTITVNASAPSWTAGTYNLITYTGAIGGGGFPRFALGTVTGLTNRQAGSAVLANPAGAVTLTVSEGSVKWTGKVSGAWTTAAIASPKNWSFNGGETDFLTNDTVVFDDTVGTGFSTVDITDANVAPTGATFANNSVSYTVVSPSGRAITGTGFVTKSGTGTVVMNNGGLNNYTGATTLNGGVFSIGTVANGGLASDLGASTNAAANLVFGGGTLQFTAAAAQATDRGFSITPGTSATFDITSAASGILTVSGAVPATTGSLVKTGGGKLTLTGANLHTGGTTVSAGILESTVNGLNGGTIQIAAGATVTFTGNNQVSTSTVTGAGAILNSTANTIVFTGDHTGFTGSLNHTAGTNNTQFNSAVSGSQDATYTLTAGEFIFAANGDYTVKMGSLSSLAGNIRGGNAATGTTTLEVGHLGGSPTIAGNLNNGGTKILALTKVGAGTLNLAGTNSYSGPTNVNAGTLRVNGALTAATGVITVASGATLAGNGNIGGNVTIQSGGHHALDVAATPGAQVTRTVGGTLDLSGVDILDLTAAAAPAAGTYTLVTATGGLTGVPDTITRTGFAGGTVTFDSNSIYLTVGAAGGFASWVSGFGLPAGEQDPTDDFDSDGLNNLMEYVLGGNPAISGTSIKPTGTKVGTDYVFTFKRSDLSEADTTQTVEYGSGLTVWGSYAVGASPGIAPVVIAEDSPSADLDTVTVTIPTGGATKFFARLKVVK